MRVSHFTAFQNANLKLNIFFWFTEYFPSIVDSTHNEMMLVQHILLMYTKLNYIFCIDETQFDFQEIRVIVWRFAMCRNTFLFLLHSFQTQIQIAIFSAIASICIYD